MDIVESDGYKWVRRPHTDDALALGHEDWLKNIISIPEGGVFVDVGAHVGHFSVRLSKKASIVYAFEPGTVQYEGLIKNLELNNITNVITVNCAVTNTQTLMSMGHFRGGSSNGQMQVKPDTDGNVEGISLDLFFQTNPPPKIDLIKIDVQGHEGEVLEGMTQTLTKYKPTLVIEMHDKEYKDPTIWTRTKTVLEQHDYNLEIINPDWQNWWVKATPK